MGRTEKAVKNIIFSIISQIITLVLTFLCRSFFIRGFGVEYLGLNGLFADVLGLLSMADLGMNTAMVFSFYKPLAEKDYDKIAALTTFYKKMYFGIAVSVSLVGLLIIPFLPHLINLETNIENLNIYYLLALVNVVISYLFVYKTSILTADQNGYVVSKITTYTTIIKTAIQICSIILFKNYILYLIIGVISTFFNNYIASKIAEKRYPYINETKNLFKKDRDEIISNILSVFVYKISSVLLSATDNILISTIVGTIIVGYYSNYLLIQNKIVLMYSLVFSAVTASIGNLIANESVKKQKEVFVCEQSVSYIISAVVVPCYVVLVNDFISLWLGKEYQLPISVVFAIGVNMYLSSVLQPLWSYREAAGIYRETKWIMLLCAFLNIVLSVLLGHKIGILGIIMASSISRFCTYVWYEPMILFKKYFRSSPREYYMDFIKNVFITFLLCLLGMLLFNKITVEGYINWILKAIICIIICFIVVFYLYRKTYGYQLMTQKIHGFKKRRFIK